MKDIPQISESELEIMKILWENSPLLASKIITSLPNGMNWSDQTIKTFLNRLLKKRAIGYKKSGRSYLYYPLISYDEYVKVENKSFLQRVYDGAVGMLFSKFLEEENLSEKEIEHLEKILEQKKVAFKKRNKNSD
jgi:BlaI family penicillinase repressor